MRTLLIVVRWLCLIAGLCGALVSTWAFIDPSAFPALAGRELMVPPPSPRWRAALGFVFSLLLVGYGAGHWLRGGLSGRRRGHGTGDDE